MPTIQDLIRRIGMNAIRTPEAGNFLENVMTTRGRPPSLRELAIKKLQEPGAFEGEASITPRPQPFGVTPPEELLMNKGLMPSPSQGELFNIGQFETPSVPPPVRGTTTPVTLEDMPTSVVKTLSDILHPGKKIDKKGTKAEPPSKEQLQALIKRVLGRELGEKEVVRGEELQKVSQALMKEQPPETRRFTYMQDLEDVKGGEPRKVLMPLEEAENLFINEPGKYQSSVTYGAPSIKEVSPVELGSPEDILGGIGYSGKTISPLSKKLVKAVEKVREQTPSLTEESPRKLTDVQKNILTDTLEAEAVWNKLFSRKNTSNYQALNTLYSGKGVMAPSPIAKAYDNIHDYFMSVYIKWRNDPSIFDKPMYKREKLLFQSLEEDIDNIASPIHAELMKKMVPTATMPERGTSPKFLNPLQEEKPSLSKTAGEESVVESKQEQRRQLQFVKEQVRAGKPVTTEEYKKWLDRNYPPIKKE